MIINWIDYLIIKKSKLFDTRYYLRQNEDIRTADINPLLHFINWGWKEGRNPSESFNTKLYLSEHPELKNSKRNPLIHYIRTTHKKNRIENYLSGISIKFIFKGLLFFLRLKGIVFFSGYPYPEREKDGYYQRIRSIDSLFSNRWRVYIDSFDLPGKESWYDFPATKTLVLKPNIAGCEKIAQICIILSVLKCGVVYFHSLLSIGRVINQKYFWNNILIKKIIDLHGAVPEEFELQGDNENAKYFNRVEEYVLQNVNSIIVVTNAMQQHIENKYLGLIAAEFITLPIFQEIKSDFSEKPLIGGKPLIIYSGGLQKWQQVSKMINAITKTINEYYFRFFCPEPKLIIEEFSDEIKINPSLFVGSKNLQDLMIDYQESHYGFILREDIVVNHVACPTKLIEYLAMGVVPIVDCEKIGDFSEMGMKYVYLHDLLDLNLPNEKIRSEFAKINYYVYEKLLQIHDLGVSTLKKATRFSILNLTKKKGRND